MSSPRLTTSLILVASLLFNHLFAQQADAIYRTNITVKELNAAIERIANSTYLIQNNCYDYLVYVMDNNGFCVWRGASKQNILWLPEHLEPCTYSVLLLENTPKCTLPAAWINWRKE